MSFFAFVAFCWLTYSKKGQKSRLDKIDAIINDKFNKIKE
jgi:hypothetical protein